MSATMKDPSSFRAQMRESRLRRIEAISARSVRNGGGCDTPKRRVLPPGFFSRHWRATLGVLAGGLMLAAIAPKAARWWNEPSAKDLLAGKELFSHKWEPHDPLSAAGDGLGPVFNEVSCAACHFQGGVGGGGGMKQNVSAFEVLPTEGHPQPTGGVVHTFAIRDEWRESKASPRRLFPIIPKGVTITAVCVAPIRADYDPLVHHSINTPTLFGAGAIDSIPALSLQTRHLQTDLTSISKEFALEFNKTISGRLRVLPDGRIGKFGWKAQFATLEEFVANACAVEVGLTTPTRKQHLPHEHREDPNAKPDLNERQFRQLVSFVSKLPAPTSLSSADSAKQIEIDRGRELFTSVGCAACHVPDVGEVKGVYSDFCLHDLTDRENKSGYTIEPIVPIPKDYPKPSEWKTPPLWAVAQTAPYFHDGSAATLTDAINLHGGQARHVRKMYRNLDEKEQEAVLAFLESLRTVEP